MNHSNKDCRKLKRLCGSVTLNCFNCGQGHKKFDCPNKKKEVVGGSYFNCWNCNSKGHASYKCDKPRKEANFRRTKLNISKNKYS